MARPPWRPSQNRPQHEPEVVAELPPSRSSRKRFAEGRRDVALELMAIADSDLAVMPLDEGLRSEVLLCRRITQHGGRRRQLQLVAKLLRGVDTAPILAALDQVHHRQQDATLRTHTVEAWRTRLITAGDPAIAALSEHCPRLEAATILPLVHAARAEAAAGLEKRAAKVLFKLLWELLAT